MTGSHKSPLAVLAGVLVLVLLPLVAQAEERLSLGWGRLFDNDAIGDGHDRWHTGSYAVSNLRGAEWHGTLPSRPFDLLEFRVEANTVAPANLGTPAPDDRRYAGIIGLGLHSQFDWHGVETNIGGDLFFTGPATGISLFQGWVHDLMGMQGSTAFDEQLGNALYPTLSAEIGHSYGLGEAVSFRPFAAASAGIETWLRVGGDFTIGHFGQGAVMLRDVTTGQRYRAVAGDLVAGNSLTFGGDVAQVYDSALFPADGGAVMSPLRRRLRLGMQWQGEREAVFYGLTWLGPEFEGQPSGQVVGSLNLNLHF